MARLALVAFLLLTVALGVMVAQRWPDRGSLPGWSLSNWALRARTASSVVPPSPAATLPQAPHAEGNGSNGGRALSPTKASDLGTPAIARAKSYSSIDTQTIAAARLQDDLLAGKPAPASVAPPSVAALESRAAESPEVAAGRSAHVSEPVGAPAIASPSRSVSARQPRDATRLPGELRATERARPPAPAPVDPAPGPSGARLAARGAPSPGQSAHVRADQDRDARVAPAPDNPPASPPDRSPVVRATAAPRASEPANDAVPALADYARVSPPLPRRAPGPLTSAQSRAADPGAAWPREAKDDGSRQLDLSWERRERWLRERLQAR